MLKLRQRFRRRGLSEGEAEAHSTDFDAACMWFGRWVESRERATKQVPRPKSKSDKIDVPKYTTRKEYLGIVGDLDTEAAREREPKRDERMDALLKDPQALNTYLGIED